MPQTPVLFYQEKEGEVPVIDWLSELKATNEKAFERCNEAIDFLILMGHELRRPHADFLQDGIHELRAKVGHVNYRILYFFHGRQAAILTSGFTKEDKVPPKEIARAVERRSKFLKNPKTHTYEREVKP